jgi:hypothetical protein
MSIEPSEPELAPEPDPDPDPDPEDLPSRRFDAWRRRSAIGGMATGVALGLQSVFYPTNNEPVISAEAPGDPPDADDHPRVVLDLDDPTKSVVIMPKATRTPPAPPAPPAPPGPPSPPTND